MLRIALTLLLAAGLAPASFAQPVPPPPAALAAIDLGHAALLTWTPFTTSPEASYNVYGVEGNEHVFLGATNITTYLAPGGFSGYAVSVVVDGTEGQRVIVCIETLDQPPYVAVGLCGDIQVPP